ncbi:MAG: hypothetical protein H0T79_13660, partial [Deltaproteobacteria bacterium]|nr:hypothetical protein [Deltaproteobacteria bacterium]
MPDLLAIVSKSMFEGAGEIAALGDRLWLHRYSSANKSLQPLGEGGRLFLITVRPPEQLWLVAVLDQPTFDGIEWVAEKSDLPITDITHLRSRLKFKTGKGIAAGGSLGASLQTPRALAAEDVVMLDAAIGKATAGLPTPREGVDEEPAVRLRRASEPENLFHHIELAKTARSACATCELAIGKGAVRVAEVYMHGDIR